MHAGHCSGRASLMPPLGPMADGGRGGRGGAQQPPDAAAQIDLIMVCVGHRGNSQTS